MVHQAGRREPHLQHVRGSRPYSVPDPCARRRRRSIHPIESQADIAAALPAHLVQFERFPDCRHAVVTDAPERAMAVIRQFIAARLHK